MTGHLTLLIRMKDKVKLYLFLNKVKKTLDQTNM